MASSHVLLSLLATSLLAVVATPLPSTYRDQRQDGELNVDKRVGNFAIVVIPSSHFNILELLMQMATKQQKTLDNNRERYKSSNDVDVDERRSSVVSKLNPRDISSDVMIAFSPVFSVVEENVSEEDKKSESISTTLEIVTKSRRTPPLSEKEQKVKLLGENIEICSPGERRDELGNCEDIDGGKRRIDEHISAVDFVSSLRAGVVPAT